jgi:hypothetical protein
MYRGKDCLAANNLPFDASCAVLRLLNRHVQLLKLVRWAVDSAVADWAAPSDPCHERPELDQLLLHLLAPIDLPPHVFGDEYLSDCTLEDIKTNLSRRLAQTPATVPSGETLLVQEATLSRRVLSGNVEVIAEARHEYDAYETLDAHIYPFELAAGIRERDKIETIRISAQDAQLGFSGRPADEKVSGDALSHFGGFFKRTWRSNDIMWGRLDGRCQLIRGLLRQDEFEERLKRPQEVAALRANLDAFARLHNTTRDKLVACLFPDGAERDQKALQSWIDRLTAGTEGAASELDGLVATIVQLSQAEIVKGGVTSVEQDAKEEATTWGEPEFEFPTGLDAAALAQSPDDFRAVYRVGEEKLSRDIPPRVLLRIFAQGALVLRDAVFGAADSRVQKHGRILARPLQFTRKVLGWPLQVAYWYATVTRARSYRVGAAVVAATLFAAFLLVGPPVLGSTTADGFQFHWPSVIAFIGLPTLVLTGEVALARARREQPRSPLWRQRLLAVLWFLVIESAIGLLVWGVVRNRYAGLVTWLTSFDGWELTILLGSPVLLVAVVLYALFRRSP